MLKLRLLAPCGALAASLCLALPAAAQGIPGTSGGHTGTPTGPVVGGGPPKAEKREPAPPAIPGATARGEAAPADKNVADMQPTDALFDAINRGDMGGARDALNRGADFEGRNVLGLTPTELSVDLGRNDITFLLLSMRGAAAGDEPAASPGGKAAAGRTASRNGPKGRASQVASANASAPANASAGDDAPRAVSPRQARQARAAAERAGSGPAAPMPVRATAQATARQYAGDGGSAIPQMGFLGFGSATR